MIDTTIAYCGYDCSKCPVYKATKDNNIELLKIILYNNDENASIDSLGCNGCTSMKNENKFCGKCPIRLCALNNNLSSCGECENFPCEKLSNISEDTMKLLKKINARSKNENNI